MPRKNQMKTHITKNYARKRQFSPAQCRPGTFRTITLSEEKGTKGVICKKKGESATSLQSKLEPRNPIAPEFGVLRPGSGTMKHYVYYVEGKRVRTKEKVLDAIKSGKKVERYDKIMKKTSTYDSTRGDFR